MVTKKTDGLTQPPPDDGTHPWDLGQGGAHGERADEHRAFWFYARQDPSVRTVAKTLKLIRSPASHWKDAPWTSVRGLEEVSQRRNWVARARAWDAYLESRRAAAIKGGLIRAALMQGEAIALASENALVSLKRWRKAMRKDKAVKWSARDVKDVLVAATTLRRLEQEQPTAITQSTVTRQEAHQRLGDVLRRLAKQPGVLREDARAAPARDQDATALQDGKDVSH